MNDKLINTNEISEDSIFQGRVSLLQPKRGYRFSIDSVLLIWFSHAMAGGEGVDLGCGCGVVGLGLLAAGKMEKMTGVEIQPRLASLARSNSSTLTADRFEVLEADMKDTRTLLSQASFGLVVSNPPYWPSNIGRLSGDRERTIACHETSITLKDLVKTARNLVHQRRGRFCLIYPARRTDDLLIELGEAGFSTETMQFVHPRQGQPAESVLVAARPGKTGRMKIDPPLVIEQDDGSYTAEVEEILSGDFSEAIRALPDTRRTPE